VVPSVADNLSLALPELPIPGVAPSRAAERGDGGSFQDALARAGGDKRPDHGASNDDSRAGAANSSATSALQSPPTKDGSQPADDSQSTNDTAERQSTAQTATESRDSEQAKLEDADDVDQGAPPVVTDEKGNDASDHEDEQEQDQAASALAALAAAQAQAKSPVAQSDEVTLSDAAKEQAAEPVAVKPVVPATAPIAPKSPKSADATATTVVATEQVAAPKVAAEAASGAKDVPTDSDTQPKSATSAATTSAEHAKSADLEQEAAPAETPMIAAAAEQSTAASDAAASVTRPEEKPSSENRSDRVGDKTSATDRSFNTTMIAASDVPASLQTASETAPASDVNIAAAATTIVGEKTDRSDASGDARRTADSGRQPDVAGIRHPAVGTESPRHASSRSAAAAFGALGEQVGSGGLSQGDRVRLVQRVARAVQTAQERGGDLQLRLSPPELGSLRLQVKMTDGALTARLEAETPQAQQVLTDGLPQLRERLAEQNIRVERFDVDLMQSGGGGPSHLPDRRQDASQDGSSSRGGATARREARSEASEGGPSPISFVAAGRLDIVA